MDKFDPNKLFPMIFQQISVKDSVCTEYGFPEEVFHRSGVGLHVIYYRTDEGRLDYEAWCYVRSVPLMRLVGVASLDFDGNSLEAANKLVTDHILNDELLPARCETFFGWLDSEDDLGQLENNPHGTEIVEHFSSFEFYLPGFMYSRADIKLQVVYRNMGDKIKYDVWCHLNHYPFLKYVGCGETQKVDSDIVQNIISKLSEDENESIYCEIEDFLDFLETIQL